MEMSEMSSKQKTSTLLKFIGNKLCAIVIAMLPNLWTILAQVIAMLLTRALQSGDYNYVKKLAKYGKQLFTYLDNALADNVIDGDEVTVVVKLCEGWGRGDNVKDGEVVHEIVSDLKGRKV